MRTDETKQVPLLSCLVKLLASLWAADALKIPRMGACTLRLRKFPFHAPGLGEKQGAKFGREKTSLIVREKWANKFEISSFMLSIVFHESYESQNT